MKKIVIIGGTNHDIFAYAHHSIKLNDSNPGYLKEAFGGVGRNIAENIARLKLNPTLITAIGSDDVGKRIIKSGSKIGIDFDIIETSKTPSYLAVLDEHKDMYVSIAAMDELEQISLEQMKEKESIIKQADLLIVDTNFNSEILKYVFDIAQAPIYVEAISTNKAQKIKPFYHKIHMLKMNLIEAKTLSNLECKTYEDIKHIGSFFHSQSVKEVFITMGKKGAYYYDGSTHHFSKSVKTNILNTTGAGDAFFAGVIFAQINQLNPLSCGIAASIITLHAEEAVSTLMNPDLLIKTMKEYQL